MARVVGIDPGLNGAVALIDGDSLSVASLPLVKINQQTCLDLPALAQLLRPMVKDAAVIVERQQAMSKQGVSSTFRTGYGYGAILGILAALDAQPIEIRSQAWKASYPSLKGLDRKSAKTEARRLAADLYPDQADLFSRVKDDGRAEAVLIGLFLSKQIVEEKGKEFSTESLN